MKSLNLLAVLILQVGICCHAVASECAPKELNRSLERTCVASATALPQLCDEKITFSPWRATTSVKQIIEIVEKEIWLAQLLTSSCEVIVRRFWGDKNNRQERFEHSEINDNTGHCESGGKIVSDKINSYLAPLKSCE